MVFSIVEGDPKEPARGGRRARGWSIVLGTPVAVWALIAYVHTDRIPDGALELNRAEFVRGASKTPPPPAEAGVARLLPDDWMRTGPGALEGWYRIAFDLGPVEEEPWGIYLPSVVMNVAVWLNGEPLGDGGRFAQPVARNWTRPLFFRFPSSLLESRNRLEIRVKADRVDTGLLGPVYVGPKDDLAPVFAWSYGVRVTALWVTVAIRVMIALATLTLWTLRRDEFHYGWFTLMVLAWVAADLNALVPEIPLPVAAWEWLHFVSIGWWAIFGIFVVRSIVGRFEARVRRRIVLFGISGTAALAVVAAGEATWFHGLASFVWLPCCALLAAHSGARPALAAWRDDPENLDFRIVCTTGVIIVGAVFYDLAMQVGLRPRGGPIFSPYTAPFVVTGMGWILARRFLGALARSEALAAGLEEDVRRKVAEVERSHARLRVAEANRVLSEERERIMRDVQDGVGSRIISILSRMEAESPPADALAASVRSTLDDLRLMIDSLEPADGNLLVPLAMLRARIEPRLAAKDVGVVWRVSDIPPVADMGPQRTLQALRLLRSAFLGLASEFPGGTLTVRTGTGQTRSGSPSVFVEIDSERSGGTPEARPERHPSPENGGSILPPSPKEGMDETRARARELGEEIDWRETPGGRVFRLSVPLARSD